TGLAPARESYVHGRRVVRWRHASRTFATVQPRTMPSRFRHTYGASTFRHRWGSRHAMRMQHYLAGLNLTGRRVVVIGGGPLAQRRLPRLVAAGAAVEVISPHVTPAVQAMADAGELTWHERRYADGDLDGAWYV